ncbi:MAG: DUF2914 domain-containing protein [Patescibacteria group bacterium]
MKALIDRLKKFVERYERHISSGALIGGFIIDSLTLQRIDQLFENLIIIFYILVAAVSIALVNLYEGGYLKGRLFERLHTFLPIVIQFVFGGLFSGFFVFYFRSSSIASSWPFILGLLILLIGNEVFKKFYKRMVFTLSIFFFCIFSFSIFSLPVLVKRIGDLVFLSSGFASLVIMGLFIGILYLFIPQRIKEVKKLLIISIGSIYAVITLFYFLNIIPPIPLSIKSIEVAHTLERTSTGYRLQQEEKKLFDFLKIYQKVHVVPGGSVYVYSSVFAPTSLTTNVVHHWRYYDENQRKWLTKNKLDFPIRGGREDGYRGYSTKSALTPGRWEVRVETPRGQVIGTIKFVVESVTSQPALQTIIY